MNKLAPDDVRHGTIAGYYGHHCRCEPCKTARARYRAMDKLGTVDERHGTYSGYSWHGCRCTRCVAGGAAYTAKRKASRPPKVRKVWECTGARSAYRRGHRCEKCRAAATANRRVTRQRAADRRLTGSLMGGSGSWVLGEWPWDAPRVPLDLRPLRAMGLR